MGLLLGQVSKWRAQRADRGAHAARGFVGGAAAVRVLRVARQAGFNAARGFVGGAARYCSLLACRCLVSMPHAALWVVQPSRSSRSAASLSRFNAARGFVGGAA